MEYCSKPIDSANCLRRLLQTFSSGSSSVPVERRNQQSLILLVAPELANNGDASLRLCSNSISFSMSTITIRRLTNTSSSHLSSSGGGSRSFQPYKDCRSSKRYYEPRLHHTIGLQSALTSTSWTLLNRLQLYLHSRVRRFLPLVTISNSFAFANTRKKYMPIPSTLNLPSLSSKIQSVGRNSRSKALNNIIFLMLEDENLRLHAERRKGRSRRRGYMKMFWRRGNILDDAGVRGLCRVELRRLLSLGMVLRDGFVGMGLYYYFFNYLVYRRNDHMPIICTCSNQSENNPSLHIAGPC